MSRLIEEDVAVERISNAIWHLPNDMYPRFNNFDTIHAVVKDAVKGVPTVEPRAKGAWVEVYDSSVGGHNSYSCSNCGLTIVTNPDYLKKHKFCFACGADMREVTE